MPKAKEDRFQNIAKEVQPQLSWEILLILTTLTQKQPLVSALILYLNLIHEV